MEVPKVFESEYRLCLILWEHEPIKSSELVQLCREQLGWKPTTTYTVIKRLSERGVLKNENTIAVSYTHLKVAVNWFWRVHIAVDADVPAPICPIFLQGVKRIESSGIHVAKSVLLNKVCLLYTSRCV